MDLAIVVVSYNTRQLTCDCLASVYAALEAAHLDGQVWVVDNASADGSAEAIRQRFPQTCLLESQENLGFARANNLALESLASAGARPRYVLFLNPDTIVKPTALAYLVGFLDEHPQAAMAGPALVYGDGSFQHSAFRFPTLAMLILDLWPLHHRLTNSGLNGRYALRLYQRGYPFPIDHPLGAAMMVRWEAIEEVGPFDPAFFMYCEEVDWCMRLKRAGWEIYCVPQACIIHLGAQSARQFREDMFVALWRSRFTLFAKHYSSAYQRIARLLVRAAMQERLREVGSLARSGVLSLEEARARTEAYRSVMEM